MCLRVLNILGLITRRVFGRRNNLVDGIRFIYLMIDTDMEYVIGDSGPVAISGGLISSVLFGFL